MISYYELLGMIKEDKAPKKIRVHLTQMTSKIYTRENDLDDTFNCYVISEDEETNEAYKYYLPECFLESSMFDKNIEILEDKPNINRLHWEQKESLNGNFDKEEKIQILARRTEKLKKWLNDLIDKLEDK